jgi:hypothetical protein
MSAAYVAQLLGTSPLHVISLAEVWLGGQKLATFQMDPASSGHTVDRSQNSRRTASVTLTEGVAWNTAMGNVPVVPQTAQNVFLPFGAEIVLYSGLVFAGAAQTIVTPDATYVGELIQLGVFGIEDVPISDTAANLVVNIDLFDRAKAVTRAGFIQDTPLPVSTEIGAAIQSILGALPLPWTLVYNFQNSGMLTPATATVYKAGDDPFDEMAQLAASCGFALYFDASGTLCFLPVPTPATQPIAWSYLEGPTNLLLELDRTISRTNAPNYIIRSGTGSDPVQAVAMDTNPLSPTYVGGSYGRQVDSKSSELITTQVQAQAAANTDLLTALGTIDAVSIQAFPRPDTDVDDVVQALRARSGVVTPQLYVVDSFSMNLGKDAILTINQARAIASALA